MKEKGGEKMDKKVMMFAVTLLALAMLVTPVMAIGPQKAKNNPNLVETDFSVQLHLPSEGFNEWIVEVPLHIQLLNASKFKIKNAIVATSPDDIVENKWIYMSSEVFFEYLTPILGEDMAHYVAFVIYPDGVYYKFVYVGK